MHARTLMPSLKLTARRQLILGSLICLIGGLFYCYEFVLRILPGALEAELSAAFGNISATAFGGLSAFYYFAYSPMQMPVGMLMDRFGPRRLLTFACLCCTLGSWMFSISSSLMIAGFGRFLVGFGSSFGFVGVLTLAFQWLPPRFFSLVAGLITTLGMLGLIYGEMKITDMTLSMGLQHVLSTTVNIGLILTILIFLFVRDGPGGHHMKNQPLEDFFRNVLKVLLSFRIWLIGFIGACLYTSLSVFGELWGQTYLEHAHHLSKVEASKTISCLFLGWAVGAPIAGYFSDVTHRRLMPLVCGALFSLICISLILYYPGLSYSSLNVLLFLYGFFSGTELIVFIMAKENSGVQLSGTVFAATNMIVTIGGVIFQPLVGKLLDFFGGGALVNGEHVYAVADYQLALSILPMCLAFVLIASLFMKDHGPKQVV